MLSTGTYAEHIKSTWELSIWLISSFASSYIQGCTSFFSEFKAEVNLVRNRGITLPTCYKLGQSQAALPCSEASVDSHPKHQGACWRCKEPLVHCCSSQATCACCCVSTTLPGWSYSDYCSPRCRSSYYHVFRWRWFKRREPCSYNVLPCEVAKAVFTFMSSGKRRQSTTSYINDGL